MKPQELCRGTYLVEQLRLECCRAHPEISIGTVLRGRKHYKFSVILVSGLIEWHECEPVKGLEELVKKFYKIK